MTQILTTTYFLIWLHFTALYTLDLKAFFAYISQQQHINQAKQTPDAAHKENTFNAKLIHRRHMRSYTK